MRKIYYTKMFDREAGSEKNAKGLGWFGATVIIINSTVGGALLTLPYSIMSAGGFAFGFTSLLIWTTVACMSVFAIIRTAHLYESKSFQELIESSLGNASFVIFETVFLMFTLSFTMFLHTELSDQLQTVSVTTFGSGDYCDHWYLQRGFLSFWLTLLIILPACLSNNITELRGLSYFAVAAIFYIVASVAYTYFVFNQNGPQPVTIPTQPVSIEKFALAIPGMVLAYTNQYSVVSVYAELKEARLSYFGTSFCLSIFISTVCYIITSFCAGNMYGGEIRENFILSFDSHDWITRTAFICYSLKLCCEYPVMQFVGWQCLATIFERAFRGFEENARIYRIASSIAWCSLTFITTGFFENLIYFGSLASLLSVIVGFVFPGLSLMKEAFGRRQMERISQSFGICLAAIGVILILVGVFIVSTISSGLPSAITTAQETSIQNKICVKS